MSGLIRLVTGKKGAAKTLWVVDQLFKEYEKDPTRNYYSDITGLKHTGVKLAPDNWTQIEDNSLIVYDEVQFKLLFSRHNSKRDKQILELTTMRKRGIEMWIITQRARFLNADVLGLVDEHVEIERNGQKTSKVFVFTDAETNITKSKKLFAHDKYVFAHPEHLYGFYESVKEGAKHGKRSYINKQIVSVVITLAMVLFFGGYFVYKTFFVHGVKVSDINEKPKTASQKTTSSPGATKKDQPQQSSQQNVYDIDCRKGENIDKAQCKQFYNDMTQNKSSFTTNNATGEIKAVSYNPNKPYDIEHIQDTVQYEVSDKPIFAGCMKKGSQYIAYTQQGTVMHGVSQSDCKRLIDDNDRPFNYFKNKSDLMASNHSFQQRSIDRSADTSASKITSDTTIASSMN